MPGPAIPCVGDRNFEDMEGAAWSYDLETVGQEHPASDGYGSEFSVQGALYDLWDKDRDNVGQTGVSCGDFLTMSLHNLWLLWNQGDFDDVSKFYGFISGLLVATDPNTLYLFSDPFVMNKIAPLAYEPADLSLISRFKEPTFTWTPHGDATPGYQNDEFNILIYKDNLKIKNLVWGKFNLKTHTYTPTKAEWKSITAGAMNSTRYYWHVMAWNTKNPRTPPANSGLGAFFSNTQSFALQPNIYGQGMIGCPGKPAALFFSGFPLEVDPFSTTFPFHGAASGFDYDNDPIYFILDGEFILEQSMVRVNMAMYSDPGYTTHIRTDRAEAVAWNDWFYDTECDLIEDTTADCRPLWFCIKFTGDDDAGSGSMFEGMGPVNEPIHCEYGNLSR